MKTLNGLLNNQTDLPRWIYCIVHNFTFITSMDPCYDPIPIWYLPLLVCQFVELRMEITKCLELFYSLKYLDIWKKLLHNLNSLKSPLRLALKLVTMAFFTFTFLYNQRLQRGTWWCIKVVWFTHTLVSLDLLNKNTALVKSFPLFSLEAEKLS